MRHYRLIGPRGKPALVYNITFIIQTKKCKNLAGWILRTFVTRDRLTMLMLFKAIVLSRLDYASQLWSPSKIYQTNLIEKVQRSFTKHIAGMHDLLYDERLKALKLYSLQRRRERYCIIYVWKILEGLVPNFSHPITATLSDRRGRSCTISNVNVGRKGTLAFNSFRWQSIRMLNGPQKYLRNITLCSLNSFKTQLDSHLIQGRQTGGGVGGVATPPEFWMRGLNTCQPPLILRRFLLGGLAPLKLI